MAFSETKKLLRKYGSQPKILAAGISLGAILFGYWWLVNFLSNFPIFSNFWINLFRSLPIDIGLGLSFITENAHLIALKKDWLSLSIKAHLTIAGTILLAVILFNTFWVVNRSPSPSDLKTLDLA